MTQILYMPRSLVDLILTELCPDDALSVLRKGFVMWGGEAAEASSDLPLLLYRIRQIEGVQQGGWDSPPMILICGVYFTTSALSDIQDVAHIPQQELALLLSESWGTEPQPHCQIQTVDSVAAAACQISGVLHNIRRIREDEASASSASVVLVGSALRAMDEHEIQSLRGLYQATERLHLWD